MNDEKWNRMKEQRIYVRPVVNEVGLDMVDMLAVSFTDAVKGDLPGTDFGGSALTNDITDVDVSMNNGWDLW